MLTAARYPSLLESSDADGGSSVAVLTYLRRILEALDHPELIHMMLEYLLAMPGSTDGLSRQTSESAVLVRRRESLMMLASNFKDDEQLTPSLFSLTDLILNSIRSSNQQTVTAAFRLISVILSKNHAYAIGTLIKISTVQVQEVHRTHGSLNAEMEAYLELAKTIGEGWVDDGYDSHVKDALKLLESHTCSAHILKLDELGFAPKKSNSSLICVREPTMHHLSQDDSMLRYILETLETFLTNSVEANLGITETIITLASCGHLQLEGWLSVEPSKYVYQDTDTNPESSTHTLSQSMTATNGTISPETDPVKALELARRRPNWYRRNTPAMLASLNTLHAELTSVRAEVPDFDILLAARRQAFLLYDAISEAIANGPPPPVPKDPIQRSPSRSSQGGSPAPKDAKKNFADRIISDFERSVASAATPTKFGASGASGAARTLNFAQRMLADYERSIGGDGSVGTRDSSPRGAPSRPRSNSKPRTPSLAPPTPQQQQQQNLGSYGLVGQRSPTMSQSRSRTQSPRPRDNTAAAKAAGKDPRELLNDVVREANAEILRRRFQFGARDERGSEPRGTDQGAAGAESSRKRGGDMKEYGAVLREASLSHILTNTVILQEFELELVAVMQVRASMFGEVRFA